MPFQRKSVLQAQRDLFPFDGADGLGQIAEVFNNKNPFVGTALICQDMLRCASDSGKIQSDDGNALLKKRIDQFVAELGMLRKVAGFAVGNSFIEARTERNEHILLNCIQVNIRAIDIPSADIPYIKDDTTSFRVIKGKCFIHYIKMGSGMPCKSTIFGDKRVTQHIFGKFQ